jgi:hypothetical protein
MSTARLRVAADPALASIVRIFVGAAAERCGVPEPVRDDLRLAASELFSGAIESGPPDTVSFELTSSGSVVEFLAPDIPAGAGASAAEDDEPGRYDLVRALFPNAEIGETVRIRVPAGT